MSQVVTRQVPASFLQHPLIGLPVVLQAPLQRARAETENIGNVLHRGPLAGQLFLDGHADAIHEPFRVPALSKLPVKLGRQHAEQLRVAGYKRQRGVRQPKHHEVGLRSSDHRATEELLDRPEGRGLVCQFQT